MKKVKKIGMVSGSLLSAAKDAEASLAREESRELEMSIPEGHPLRNEAERQKTLIGDLGGLPPGHPFLLELQKAKDHYDQQQNKREIEQERSSETRKIKKIETIRENREARRLEDDALEERTRTAKRVDSGVNSILSNFRILYKTVSESEEILNKDPLCRAKIVRLKRLLIAIERGLSESKIYKVRL